MKFNPHDQNLILSGGWDKVVNINDIRDKGPVSFIYGPYICGEAIDMHPKDDRVVLTGSYCESDVLQLWDIRKTSKPTMTIDWDAK